MGKDNINNYADWNHRKGQATPYDKSFGSENSPLEMLQSGAKAQWGASGG